MMKREALVKDSRVIPPLLSQIMGKRKVQTVLLESRVNLLSFPATVEDVRATIKVMASGRHGVSEARVI